MSELQDWVGVRESREDRVSEAALARYAATLEPLATSEPGIAPPGFHWCLCLPEDATGSLDEDGHPPRGGLLPPVALPRRMWAASALEFVAPLRVGARIARDSRVAAVTPKRGRSGAMVLVELEHLIRADGADAVRERQTLVYREAAAGIQPLPQPRPIDTSAWPHARRVLPSELLLFRFSALSFNSHRIHYDLAYAREREGYPALVVQAPLIAALLLDLAAASGGRAAPAGFSFRATAPAFAGQPLYLLGREDDGALRLAALGADGGTVMEARATWR